MQGIIRPLIVGACALLLAPDVARAQVVVCPGEPVIFQVAEDYYGTKSWEYSPDGITWNAVEVIENEPLSLQPEQLGWYRVRFHDTDCNTTYVGDPLRFDVPAIDLGATLSLSIGGQVTNEAGEAVRGATVRAGCGAGITTTTDGFGVFLLEGITAYEQLATVSVEKEGYLNGSRSFVPAASASETVSYVNITLLAKNVAGTVNGAAGGTVALEGVTITFPPNAFLRDGQPYTGAVTVALNHIDPTSDSLHLQMPGMLMGVMDDQPQMLLSYGMVGAELSDDAGRTVQL
ncbi:MAG: carboxypeptidase regulatory-like domain-containing protein, partial [Flavobacteriales bacterium]|nr:carboxypeptidase regulatory-like domain-containing protein [Flavobacteriales bacterium]